MTTDDTDKKTANDDDAGTDASEATAATAATDDDGWGQAADDAGWGPPMPSAQPEDEDVTPQVEAGHSSAHAEGSIAAAEEPSGDRGVDPTPEAADPEADDGAWEQSRASRYEGAAPIHYVPPDMDVEPDPPPTRRESLRSAVGLEKKPSRAERAKAKAAAKAEAKAAAKTKAKPKVRAKANVKAKAKAPSKRRRGGADDDEPPEPRFSPRAKLIAVLVAIAAVGVGTLVVLGMFNSKQYFFVCHAKKITAERGRQFPPWGRAPLSGEAWKPIAIPPNTECVNAELSDPKDLELLYADALYTQADKRLLSRDPSQIDEAAKQLTQALLLTRDPERKGKREAITRLHGDVDYARAKAQATSAAATLNKAAAQFERATQKHPRHTADSAAWAAYTRHMSGEILRGPTSLRKDLPPETRAKDASAGATNPPPGRDAGVPAAAPVDAEPGTALPPETDATPIPPDAGVPTGGVLL